MTYVRKIVDAFGGVRSLARALALPPSTVQGWQDRGSIPDGRKASVLKAGQIQGIELSEKDFFPHAAQPSSEDAA